MPPSLPPSLPPRLTLRTAAGLAAYDGHGGAALFGRLEGFAPETRIATLHGDVPIETLRPGDFVLTPEGGAVPVTRSTSRRLDAAALTSHPTRRAVIVQAGAFGPGRPREALRLAPGQAIHLDGRTAAVAALVNGTTVAPDRSGGAITFMRLLLGRPAMLSAGGLACPLRSVPRDPQAEVALRGAADRAAGVTLGPLDGGVEEASPAHVVGWVLDTTQPDAAIPLEIAIDGVPIAWAFADQRRPDLEMRGLGNGACAYAVRFSAPLAAGRTRWLTVRRATDGADVPGSPILLRRPDLSAMHPASLGLAATLAAVARRATTNAARAELAGGLFAEIDLLAQSRPSAHTRSAER